MRPRRLLVIPGLPGLMEPLEPRLPQESPRVLRGGSWLFPSRYLRAADRNGFHPRFRSGVFGFRVVLEVK